MYINYKETFEYYDNEKLMFYKKKAVLCFEKNKHIITTNESSSHRAVLFYILCGISILI